MLAIGIFRSMLSSKMNHLPINILSGALIVVALLASAQVPAQVAMLPDLNSNGSPEVAVLFEGGSSHVHIRDGITDALISEIDFGDDPVSAMVVIDDISGNGMPEIALLGTRPRSGRT